MSAVRELPLIAQLSYAADKLIEYEAFRNAAMLKGIDQLEDAERRFLHEFTATACGKLASAIRELREAYVEAVSCQK